MSLGRRLSDLEARASGTRWETPIEARVLLKAVVRHRARENGEELPEYSQEDIAHMHAEDLADVAGGGVEGHLRSSPGWQPPDAQARLDEWEESARRRLERAEDGESLEIVYDELLDEGEELHDG